MKVYREFAIPNKRTFEILPIKNLLWNHFGSQLYLDPFPFESRVDCFDYLDKIDDNSYDFGVLDPPYTRRQVSEHYKKNNGLCSAWDTSSGWTSKVKREMAKKIRIGGKVISFGYNSAGMNQVNGFKIIDILLVNHGGDHYDTICTVSQKV